MNRRGAYEAKRAAALSGVPLSTVHYWARNRVLVPAISPVRTKLWSYSDLMGLRTIYWLRQPKPSEGDELDVPRTSMRLVKRALAALEALDLALWDEDTGPSVAVDRRGEIHIEAPDGVAALSGQQPIDLLDLIRPFPSRRGIMGPDLHAPRPLLRIVPGKLAGSPHVAHTRVETRALAALAQRGMPGARLSSPLPARRRGGDRRGDRPGERAQRERRDRRLSCGGAAALRA